MYSSFDYAVETARQHTPIQKRVVKPEFWSRYAIIAKAGSYRVIEERGLTPPETPGLLPWFDPLSGGGEVIAFVGLDGSVSEV